MFFLKLWSFEFILSIDLGFSKYVSHLFDILNGSPGNNESLNPITEENLYNFLNMFVRTEFFDSRESLEK